MKGVFDYSEPIRKLWVIHEAFRRLGFSSDDIYVGQHNEPVWGVTTPTLNCTLKTQEKEFVVSIAHYKKGEIWRAFDEWTDFVTKMTNGEFSERDLMELFHEWPFPGTMTQFVMALTVKGFKLPSVEKRDGQLLQNVREQNSPVKDAETGSRDKASN